MNNIKKLKYRLSPAPKWAYGYALILAYLLFPILMTNDTVVGGTVRANVDVGALTIVNDALFWAVMFFANVVLLPMCFQAAFRRDDVCLRIGYAVWKVLWGTLMLASVLAVVGGKWLGTVFSWLWFWWDDFWRWLGADSQVTLARLDNMRLRYDVHILRDMILILLAMLPFRVCYVATLPKLPKSPISMQKFSGTTRIIRIKRHHS